MTTSGPSGVQRWPALGLEKRAWHYSDEARRLLDAVTLARWDGVPYDAAVVPAIAALDPRSFLSAAAVEDIAEAQAEVAAFDKEAAALPVPMPAMLLRTESASSSQIENLTVNARNLARAVVGLPGGPNGSIVAANVAAMTRALDVTDGLTLDAVLAVHRALLEGTDPNAGRLRSEPVWVGRRSDRPHGADFVPPRWESVGPAMEDLLAFAAVRKGGALLRAAVTHAHFETIHPFTDGNGRTGRALVHTMLRSAGVVRHSTVPVSAGILGDVAGYVAALTAYRAGDLEPIVATFAAAARAAVANGRALARRTGELRDDWRAHITARSDSAAWRLADAIFEQPVVTSGYVASALDVSLPSALSAIDKLVEAGVLSQTSRDRRNRVWHAPEVLDAMDEFAQRARRGRI